MTVPELNALVTRIHQEGLSRNKHYELFDDPVFQRAHRLHGYFKRVARLLSQFRDRELKVKKLGDSDRYQLDLQIPEIRFNWVFFLTRTEVDVLQLFIGTHDFRLPSSVGIDMVPAG